MGSFVLQHFEAIVGIGVIMMLGIIYLSAIAKKQSILDRFVDKLEIIIGIFGVIGVILTYSVFRRNLDQASIDTTFKIVDRAWTNVNKEFADYYDKCPNFINSLFFDWQVKAMNGDKNHNKFKNDDDWHAVNYISCIIFQSVEDMMTSQTFDETGDNIWLANSVQWFKSPELKKIWATQRPNYVATARELIDLVITHTENTEINNVKELEAVIHRIAVSDTYNRIVTDRESEKSLA